MNGMMQNDSCHPYIIIIYTIISSSFCGVAARTVLPEGPMPSECVGAMWGFWAACSCGAEYCIVIKIIVMMSGVSGCIVVAGHCICY